MSIWWTKIGLDRVFRLFLQGWGYSVWGWTWEMWSKYDWKQVHCTKFPIINKNTVLGKAILVIQFVFVYLMRRTIGTSENASNWNQILLAHFWSELTFTGDFSFSKDKHSTKWIPNELILLYLLFSPLRITIIPWTSTFPCCTFICILISFALLISLMGNSGHPCFFTFFPSYPLIFTNSSYVN